MTGEGYPVFISTVRGQLEKRWLRREWPVIVIILLPFLMFGRSLLPGRVFSAADILFFFYPWHALESSAVPQNSLLGDRTFVLEPWLIYASRQIRNGRFPLWNVHAYCGAPLLGNFISALLFPFNALAYALPVETALGFEAILRLVTAGLSMYWNAAGAQATASTRHRRSPGVHVQRFHDCVVGMAGNQRVNLASAASPKFLIWTT